MINTLKYKPENDALQIKLPIRNPREEYECWYYNALLESGDYFSVKFSINENFSVPVKSGVKLELLDSENKLIQDSILVNSNDTRFSSERCDIKIGENWCIDHGDYYEIYTLINGNGAHLKFFPETPGWIEGDDGILNKNITGIKFMGWSIPVPMAKVEGVLFKNGKKFQAIGKGSHNHVWGNEYFGENVNYLQMGEIFTQEFALAYFLVVEENDFIISKLLLINKDGLITEFMNDHFKQDLKIELSDIKENEELKVNIPSEIRFKSQQNNKLILDIKLTDFISKRLSIDSCLGSQKSASYKSDVNLELEMDSLNYSYKTTSINEIHSFL